MQSDPQEKLQSVLQKAQRKPQIWAHRGFSSRFPENTLPSFAAALQLGVDGLEFDIHRSRDGEIVIHHDERLGRTNNGTGLVGQLTLRELKELDAGSWFAPQFAGVQIPTLGEVLDLVTQSPSPVFLNLESKSGPIHYPQLEEDAWQMLCDRGMEQRAIISSFNHFSLRELKQKIPTAQIGLLYQAGLVDPWRYAQSLEATAIHPFFASFDDSVVQGCHEHGITIHTYTVNDKKVAQRLKKWGVDAIITDRPDLFIH